MHAASKAVDISTLPVHGKHYDYNKSFHSLESDCSIDWMPCICLGRFQRGAISLPGAQITSEKNVKSAVTAFGAMPST